MFKKILVANRGEIACRVIRTARRMGIATVAVYSEADRNALHVEMADEAVAIGPRAGGAKLSLDRAHPRRRAGRPAPKRCIRATASSPRMPAFARALEAAGIVFIGPPAGGDRGDGRQDRSRRSSRPRPASRPCRAISGSIADDDEAARIAAGIGYPVMVKASAGGGGKGMRVAADEAALREGFRARPLGGALLLRRRPRVHREIHRGAAPHRDPGARRRARQLSSISASANARSSGATRRSSRRRRRRFSTRRRARRWARRRSRSRRPSATAAPARSSSSSTATRNFYFLEMNTRLQVEHPVTELVTGLDLVEEMIRIAAGEKLRHRPGGCAAQRLGGRGAHLCRGSVPRVPAVDRAADALPAAGRGTSAARRRSASTAAWWRARRSRSSTIR